MNAQCQMLTAQRQSHVLHPVPLPAPVPHRPAPGPETAFHGPGAEVAVRHGGRSIKNTYSHCQRSKCPNPPPPKLTPWPQDSPSPALTASAPACAKPSSPSQGTPPRISSIATSSPMPCERLKSSSRHSYPVHSPPGAARRSTPVVAKLKRQKTRLSTMQDIAGCRIVVPGIVQQDEAVGKIQEAFDILRTDDLREEPHSGYRAVHVIVTVPKGHRVEIQIRTPTPRHLRATRGGDGRPLRNRAEVRRWRSVRARYPNRSRPARVRTGPRQALIGSGRVTRRRGTRSGQ